MPCAQETKAPRACARIRPLFAGKSQRARRPLQKQVILRIIQIGHGDQSHHRLAPLACGVWRSSGFDGPATRLRQRPAVPSYGHYPFGLAGHGRNPAHRNRHLRAGGHALRFQISVGAADGSAAAADSPRQAPRLGHHRPAFADRRDVGLGSIRSQAPSHDHGRSRLAGRLLFRQPGHRHRRLASRDFAARTSGRGRGCRADRISHRHAGLGCGRAVHRLL